MVNVLPDPVCVTSQLSRHQDIRLHLPVREDADVVAVHRRLNEVGDALEDLRLRGEDEKNDGS